MKAMVSITLFDGGDPATGEQRSMTIGELDDARLPAAVAEWAHDVVARMLAGVGIDTDDEPGVPLLDVSVGIWDQLTDGAA